MRTWVPLIPIAPTLSAHLRLSAALGSPAGAPNLPAAMKACCRALRGVLLGLAAVGAAVFLAGAAALHAACNGGRLGKRWLGAAARA